MQPSSKINKPDHRSGIIRSYQTWSIHSKSNDFQAMSALTLPNSTFHELTQTCRKSHQTGNHYFYAFEEMEMVSLSKTKTEATVRGTIILSMPGVDIKYKGEFISTCRREDSSTDWKLNDIEIDWEL